MSIQNKQTLISQLKQSMVDKQRFNDIIGVGTRLNRQMLHVDAIPTQNTLLPSISQTKVGLTTRMKSHSAKKINKQASTGSLFVGKKVVQDTNDHLQNKISTSSKKIDLETAIIKRQSLFQSSNKNTNLNRVKNFSVKTNSNLKEPKISDFLEIKNAVNARSDFIRQRQNEKEVLTKQLNRNLDELNSDFLLVIKQKRIDQDSLKRINKMLQKSSHFEVARVLRMTDKIDKFCLRYGIQNGNIQYSHMCALSSRQVLSNYQLFELFLNKKAIRSSKKIVGLQYYTVPEDKGLNLAAKKITSFFRMIFAKRFYVKFRSLLEKVSIIQRFWRSSLIAKKARKDIAIAATQKISKYNRLGQELVKNWNMIKCGIRYQVHICSYSLQQFKRITMSHLRQRQNTQITRIFRAANTDTHIIYVVPFALDQQVIRYYKSVFNFKMGQSFNKVYFVIAQNSQRLQQYSQLTAVSLLLYSPKALKRIHQIIGKNYGFIVPSFPSVQYINLSAELNLPVMAPQQNIAKLYSTKSGCLKIFKNIVKKQNSPFELSRSVHSIFSQKQLINTLSLLIYHHTDVKIWYLKIQDEIQGRGLAYLNINKIAFLRELCSGQGQFQGIQQKQIIKLIAQELTNKLKIRLKIINKQIYANYQQYISHFLTRGGMVQAGVPQKSTQFSMSFFIQPSGDFSMVGTYNKLQLGGKSINQAIKFPSSLNIDYAAILRHLYKQIWVKLKLYGYFTADFLYSQNIKKSFAIGFDCFLNQKTSSLFMASYCTRSNYQKDSNTLVQTQYPIHYIYCPMMTLPCMPNTSTFFKNCKFGGISYDLQKHLGTIFVLLNRTQDGQLGFICAQSSQMEVLQELKKLVEYFTRHHRQDKSSNDQIGLLKGIATTWLKKLQKNIKKEPFKNDLDIQ